MPELPEVEATCRYLAERVVDERITAAQVLWARTVATGSAADFERAVQALQIKEIFRRGKFVGIKLTGESELDLLVHLRMSGSLDVISSATPIDRHDRVVLHLANGRSIRFHDTRKFGRMYLVDDHSQITGNLGVEPLSDQFDVAYLRQLLLATRGSIKPLLLNQRCIAGLGNIYVDESLWKARIHPLSPAAQISLTKTKLLHTAIRETLCEAIRLAGTDFGDGVVDGGGYEPLVYGRTGQGCQRCGGIIRRIVVGQRGTHLCTRCQV
jgi:formamidopyrimidine-DNA glycosylase